MHHNPRMVEIWRSIVELRVVNHLAEHHNGEMIPLPGRPSPLPQGCHALGSGLRRVVVVEKRTEEGSKAFALMHFVVSANDAEICPSPSALPSAAGLLRYRRRNVRGQGCVRFGRPDHLRKPRPHHRHRRRSRCRCRCRCPLPRRRICRRCSPHRGSPSLPLLRPLRQPLP